MNNFKLKEDGDKYEREWEEYILPNFPNYEVYWSEYVVPLTYRSLKKEVIYLRRSVPELLKKPANFNYELFLHLIGSRLAREDMGGELNPFNLFNFFAHIHSATQDKCYEFLRATEKVIHNYTGKIYKDQEMRFTNLGYPKVYEEWQALQNSTGGYRNKLVHTGYINFTKDKLPKESQLDNYHGIHKISELLIDESASDKIDKDFEDAILICDDLIFRAESIFNNVMEMILEEMTELDGNSKYEDDRDSSDGDRELLESLTNNVNFTASVSGSTPGISGMAEPSTDSNHN